MRDSVPTEVLEDPPQTLSIPMSDKRFGGRLKANWPVGVCDVKIANKLAGHRRKVHWFGLKGTGAQRLTRRREQVVRQVDDTFARRQYSIEHLGHHLWAGRAPGSMDSGLDGRQRLPEVVREGGQLPFARPILREDRNHANGDRFAPRRQRFQEECGCEALSAPAEKNRLDFADVGRSYFWPEELPKALADNLFRLPSE
jgi:hypothetical protein